MRILHTADWHLGRQLEGRSRHEEHVAFVDELCTMAARERVDLVLLAGDIYDGVNPSAAAEELYCDALARLADGGRRAVVVVAGNHDNPDRLCAVRHLARQYGITFFGYPGDDPGVSGGDPNLVRRVAAGPGWAELAVPGVAHTTVVLALAYPSEARLQEVLAETLSEEELQAAYSSRVARWYADRALESGAEARTDCVRLGVSHLFAMGGLESVESERPIQMGGAYVVEPAAFPPELQYVALGHLHRAQAVGAEHIRYSGSPLTFSFGESIQMKSVTLVDLEPKGAPALRELPVLAGRPLVTWKAKGGLAEVESWVAEGRDPHAWINLEVHVEHMLTMDQVQRLRGLRSGFVHIRPIVASAEAEAAAGAEQKVYSLQEQFERFYAQRCAGAAPHPELVRLFLELASDEAEAEAEA